VRNVKAAQMEKYSHPKMERRLIDGAGWSIAGSVLSQGITLITLLFVARILGKEAYGQFVLIQSTVNMVGVIAGFGIGQTAMRYVAAMKERDTVYLGQILAFSERTVFLFGTFMSVVLAIFSQQIASTVLNRPVLSTPLSIAAIAVLFSSLDGYQKSLLIGIEAMRSFAIGTTICVTLNIPIMLYAVSEYGVTGAAGALAVSTFTQAVISRYQSTRELKRIDVKPIVKGCLGASRVMHDFAIPALLAGIIASAAHWVCQAMLANTPEGFIEIAILGIAMQWFNVIQFLPSVAGKTILPMLTDYLVNQNHVDSRRLLRLAVKANAFVAIPLALMIALFSPLVLSFYGPDYQNSSVTLVIAAFTAALLAIQLPIGNMVAATSRMWLGVLMNTGWAIVYITAAYLSIERGSTGVIIGLCLAYMAHTIWTFWFAKYHFNFMNNA
jgi:O-antigen/teichoic acid export membrane protein